MSHLRSRVPKHILFFGVMLALSFAWVGGLGTYLAKGLNAEYSRIVTSQLPSIGLVREVSKANATGRRLLEATENRLTGEELGVLQGRIAEIRVENSARLAQMDMLLGSVESVRLSERLRMDRHAYHELADEFIVRLSQGLEMEERAMWRARIEEADAKYVEAQDRLADYCLRSATAQGDVLTRSSTRLMWFFMVFAAWPLLLVSGIFLYGFISTLLVFIRSRRNV